MKLPLDRGLVVAVCLLSVGSTFAQTYSWTTFAGRLPQFGSADGTGSNARFYYPDAIATARDGNIYVSDTYNHTIRRISAGGTVTTLAGRAGEKGSADGLGGNARFNLPRGLAVDGDGNIYVVEAGNHTLRKITSTGLVTTLAGLAGQIGSADGTGSAARFYTPLGVAVDRDANVFVADYDNGTIRKVTPGGVVSTVAGLARAYGSADGTGGAARLNGPSGIAIDGTGNLFVTDYSNSNIRKITPEAVVTTVAGMSGVTGTADGTGAVARFNSPQGITIDAAGNFFVADTFNNLIRKMTPAGAVTTFAGDGAAGSADGTGRAARFLAPYGVAVEADGNLVVADANNHSIRRISPAAEVVTFVGPGGTFGSSDGSGTAARFNYPQAITEDDDGTLFVSDGYNSTIRRVTPAGQVTTFAGSVGNSSYVNGASTVARFGFPAGIAATGGGNLVVLDQIFSTVRTVSSGASVAGLAGQPGQTGSVDGTGTLARFNFPLGVCADRAGNTYVADTYNHTIRKVTLAGVVTTLAGVAGAAGSADGAGCASARFNYPTSVTLDGAGNLYVADYGNDVIRRIDPSGAVSTIAGLARTAGSVDGFGTNARFSSPTGVAVDAAGIVYVADRGNSTVRRIALSGAVTTIGGAPGDYGGAEGSGAAARFGRPASLIVSRSGVLYVVDAGNNTIMKGVPEFPPVMVVPPPSLALAPGSRALLTAAVSGGNLRYQWNLGGAPIAGATAGTYVIASAQPANAGNYTVTVSNSAGSITSAPAAISIVATTDTGRISNLAIRSQAGSGGQTLIVGLAVGGAGTAGAKPILVRGVGPALGGFGVTGFLPDPKLEIYSSATGSRVYENDNWGGDAQVSATSARLGAFSLGAATSRDAALFVPALPSGSYTVQVSSVGAGAGGVALAEVYDATATGGFGASTPRLINVSARTEVGTGGDILIAGFYVGGLTARNVLIRAVGPTLAVFGVAGALADPKLELFNGATRINENDDWRGDAALEDAFTGVGAFALSRNSKDAAMLVTLAPGSYTAQISGVNGTSGVALVEVYEAP